MKVHMQDVTYEADTPTGILAQMQQADWGEAETYLDRTAEAAQGQTGREIRTTNALTFLFDLERAGLLRMEDLSTDQARDVVQLQQQVELWIPVTPQEIGK